MSSSAGRPLPVGTPVSCARTRRTGRIASIVVPRADGRRYYVNWDGLRSESPSASLMGDAELDAAAVLEPSEPTLPPKRSIYHVVHDGRSGRWRIEREGAARATALVDTRVEVLAIARKLGQAAEHGQIVLHRADGSVEKVLFYGGGRSAATEPAELIRR